MHKFSTAATKSSALAALRDPQAGAPALARSALSSLHELDAVALVTNVTVFMERDTRQAVSPSPAHLKEGLHSIML